MNTKRIVEAMNRHRAYWSAMGYEPPSDEEAEQIRARRKEKRNQDKETLRMMIESNETFFRGGQTYVLDLLREIAEDKEREAKSE